GRGRDVECGWRPRAPWPRSEGASGRLHRGARQSWGAMRRLMCLAIGVRSRLAVVGLVAAATVSIVVGGAAAHSTTAQKTSALKAAVVAFAAGHPTYPGVEVAVISPRLHWLGAAGHEALASREAVQPEAGFRSASKCASR